MLGVLVTLVIIGVILWAVNAAIPMQPQIKTIVNVVAILFVCLWLLQVFGVAHTGMGTHCTCP